MESKYGFVVACAMLEWREHRFGTGTSTCLSEGNWARITEQLVDKVHLSLSIPFSEWWHDTFCPKPVDKSKEYDPHFHPAHTPFPLSIIWSVLIGMLSVGWFWLSVVRRRFEEYFGRRALKAPMFDTESIDGGIKVRDLFRCPEIMSCPQNRDNDYWLQMGVCNWLQKEGVRSSN